ncbi:Glucokinase [subsurface metagenome]
MQRQRISKRQKVNKNKSVSINPLVLGVDLGGSKILSAVVNVKGEILSRDRSTTPAAKGPEAVIQAMLESAKRVLNQAGITTAELEAICIGAPGLSNPKTGVVFTSPHLPRWTDVPLRNIIEKKMDVKTLLLNDTNAAALGELYFGAAKGARNFICVTLGTGIGGGIVIDGEIYAGSLGTAGEIGHMTIDTNGPKCNCGNTGCWETLASGTALAREAKQRISDGAKTSILEYADGDVNKVNAETVHKAAQQGDTLAKELIAQLAYYIGVGLANLIHIFNPELIVIGGGLSNIGDMLLEPAYKLAGERVNKTAFASVRFARAELGRNSGVIGAAAYAFREIGKLK